MKKSVAGARETKSFARALDSVIGRGEGDEFWPLSSALWRRGWERRLLWPPPHLFHEPATEKKSLLSPALSSTSVWKRGRWNDARQIT
jgi:hypothetical protein